MNNQSKYFKRKRTANDNNVVSEKQRFATRKSKVGVVSVLLGFTLIFGGPTPKLLAQAVANGSVYAAETQALSIQNYKEQNSTREAFITNKEGSITTNENSSNENLKKIDNAVQVEAKYNNDGTTDWTLTFNNGPIQIGDKEGYQPNPIFGFFISKDLEFVGNITFGMKAKDGDGSYIYRNNENVWNAEKQEYNSAEIKAKDSYGGDLLKVVIPPKDGNRDKQTGALYDIKYLDSRSRPSKEQWFMNDRDAQFNKVYRPSQGEANQYANSLMDNRIKPAEEGYKFNYRTGDGGKNMIKVTFKTKPTDKADNKLKTPSDNKVFSGVSAVMKSWDKESELTHAVNSYGLPYAAKDTDDDGLPDLFEMQELKTDYTNVDTDGDGRADGTKAVGGLTEHELENPVNIVKTASGDKLAGTDPTVATPREPYKKVEMREGYQFSGKTQPYKTVAFVTEKGTLGEAVADENGDYTITIGTFIQRGGINEYGNNMKLKDPAKRIPWTETRRIDLSGKAGTIEIWSDGLDRKPLYSLPEKVSFLTNASDAQYYKTAMKDPNKVLVKETELTAEEIQAVKAAVIKANPFLSGGPDGADVKSMDIDNKGNVKVAFGDGSEINPAFKADKTTVKFNMPVKTDVSNPNSLTEQEIAKIREAIKTANADLKLTDEMVKVNPNSTAEITYPDSPVIKLMQGELVKSPLDGERDKAIEEINNHKNLNPTQKESAIEAVEGAGTSEEINTAKTNAQTLDNSMGALKEEANKSLNIKKSKAYNTAPEEEKKAYDDALKDALEIISGDNTANANSNNEQVLTAKKKLEDAENALYNVTAKKEIEEAAEAKIKEIEGVEGASQVDKDKKKAEVEAAKKSAIDAIEKAENDTEVKNAVTAGKTAISNIDLPQSVLEKEKTKATSDIKEAAKEAKAEVDGLNDLTQIEKDAAIKKIEEEKTAAIGKIDAAKTVEDVTKEKDAGLTAINKEEAKAAVIAAADEKTKAIKASEGTEEEKNKAIEAVNSAKKDALGKIEVAQKAADVTKEKNTGIEEINKVAEPQSSLEKAKEAAKSEIEEAAKEAKAKVNGLQDLTDEEKTVAIKKIEDEKTVALGKIDAAQNEGDVTTAKTEGLIAISKEEAKAAVIDAAEAKNKAIKDAKGTTEDTEKATAAVDAAKKDAIEKIDAAKKIEDVTTEKNAGVSEINKVAVPQSVLDKAKTTAKSKIEQAANEAKAEVDGLNNLTDEEKGAAIKKIEEEKTAALGKIDAAQNADDVTTEETAGLTAIDKEEAKAAVIDAAEAKNKAITDANGPAEETKTAKDTVEKAKNEAIGKIDVADNAGKITTEKNAGITEINNVEVPQSSLDKAKETAKSEIEEAAVEAKAEVDGLKNLTDDEKTAAKDAIENAKNTALDNIAKAENEQGVTDVKTAGLTSIDKEEAKAAVIAAAEAKNKAITDAKGTDEDTKTAKAAVDAAKDDALKKIDAAENTEGVAKEKTDGITAINNVEVPQSALDKAKEAAKSEIEEAAKEAEAKVNGLQDLTKEERDAAIANIEKAKNAALENIAKAENEQGVTDAKTAGLTAIDKEEAKAVVIATAEEKNKAIDASNGTTDDTKTAKDAVDAAKKAALENINGAKTKEEVTGAKNAGVTAINDVKVPQSALDKAKEAAKSEIEEAAKEAEAKVNGLKDLSEDAKKAAIANIENAKNTALENIAKADNTEAVTAAKNTGLTAIDKEQAKAAVIEAAELKNKAIKDSNGTDEDKTKAKDAVETAKNAALENIETAGDVEKAKTAGINEINNVEVPGKGETPSTDLDRAKAAAKSEIEEVAREAEAKVNGLNDLSEDAKNKAIKSINDAKEAAIRNIDDAQKEADVTTAKNAGLNAINKEEAKAAVIEAAEVKKKAIDASGGTKEDKDKATAALDKAKQDALGKIDEAATAENVTGAKNAGITAINNVAVPQSALDKEKASAISEIEEAAREAEAKVNGLNDLTGKEKEAANKKINEEKTAAIEAVENATNKDNVTTAKNAGITAINKEEAKAAVIAAAEAKKKSIDSSSGTKEDKDKAEEAVESAKTAALKKIDDAATAGDVEKEKNAGIEAVNKVAIPQASLDKEKAAAISEIEEAAREAEAKVNGLKDLSNKEREDAINNINEKKTAAIKAVKNAANKDDVTTAKNTGIFAINKEEAKAAVIEAAEAKNKAITAANPKEGETKAARDAVEKEKKAALDEIDAAKTAEGVTSEKNAGITAINNVEIPYTSLHDAKEAAKAEIEEAAKEAKAKVNGLKDLSEKADAIKKIEEEKTKALGNIDNATTADDVTGAKNTGITAINKEEAKAAVIAAAEAKNNAINTSSGTEADKKAAKDAVEKEKKAALDNITKADNAEAVTDAKTAGITEINNIAAPQTSLDKAKEAVKSEIEEAAKEAKAEVKGLKDLSDEEKAAAIEKIESAKKTAIENIDAAQIEENITEAKNAGLAAINKEEAKAAVIAAAEAKNKAITAANASEEETNAAKDKVEKEKNSALENITKADSKEAVTSAKNAGIEAIDNVEVPYSSLDKAKEAAKAEIEEAAKEAKAKVNGLKFLLDKERTAAIEKIESEKTAALGNIDNANDIAGVTTAKNAGITAINKEEAKAAVIEAAKAKIEAIEVSSGTNEEKAKAKTAVDKEKKAALDNISEAKDNNAVITEKYEGIEAINGVEVPGESETPSTDLSEAKLEAKFEIDNMENLNDAQKDSLKNEVDSATKAEDIQKVLDKARTLNVDMGNLKRSVEDKDTVTESNDYKNADQDKKDAYDAAVSAAENILVKEGPNSDSKAVKDAEQAVEDAKKALNGDAKNIEGAETTDKAKETANISIGNMQNLNDAQKNSLEEEVNKILDNDSAKNDITQIIENGKELNEDMGKLKDLVADKDAVTRSFNYRYASPNKIEAYDNAVKEAEKIVAKEGSNSNSKAVKDAIKAIEDAKKALKPDSSGTTGGKHHSSSSSSSGVLPTPSTGTSDRISGSNRVATAVNVSKLAYANGAKTVILANSEKFSDVLAAMPYGKTINAPVLYTNFNDIPEETLKELKRLGVENIILVGGNQTISALQQRALEGMGYKTDRINGQDRYETALLIAERMQKAGAKGINNVIIASGETFPDALSISPLAVTDETPILLAEKNTISSYTIKGLEMLKANKIYISGGNMSVSQTVEAKLKPYTKQAITRFAGQDRYETSAVIAKALKPNAKTSVFASGEVFPDAMVAGELVNYYNAPLLLVEKNEVPESVGNYVKSSDITKNVIVGGEKTISNEVVEKLQKLENR